jgi:type I restriction enzyme S subunit
MEKWLLPVGWEWTTVRKIVKDTSTRNPSQLPDQQFYYLDISAIDNAKGTIKPINQILGKDAPSRARKVIQKDDVIFATTRPYLKNIALVPENYDDQICSTGFCVLRANKDLIIPTYLYYLCRSGVIMDQLEPKMRGASYPAVSDNDVMQVEIPLPLIYIQEKIIQRIEAIFSELSEARRLHEKIVADTNRLMNAVLAEVYPTSKNNLPEGWGFLSLPDICAVNPTRPRNLTQSNETMTSFVPMAAVDEREGRITDLQAQPFGEVKRGYTYFEENDILFAKITPCMENGKAAIARDLNNHFGFGSTEFHVLRPRQGILPEWIYYYIRRETFRQEAKTKFRGAVGQQRVPNDFLETHLIPVPFPENPEKSLSIQKQIVTYVQTTAEQVAETQVGNMKTGTLLNQMEQSILSQAFRGEL